jgi:hypothetical protein
MLKITIKGKELFDERTNEFISTNDTVLQLEHSLISLSKWESKWHKPFLNNNDKTEEEMIDYIRCMTITQNVDPSVYYGLSQKNILEIKNYMDDPMTATWFSDKSNPKSKQKAVTAELIYYWMITLGVPISLEKWHLNRLLTLIRVCNIENAPKKRMKRNDVLRQNSSLNQIRRQMMNSSG